MAMRGGEAVDDDHDDDEDDVKDVDPDQLE